MRNMIGISVFLILSVSLNPLSAYDGKVHRIINEKAIDPINSKLDQILKEQIGIVEGIDVELIGKNVSKTIKDWVIFGGEAEDYGYWPKDNPTTTRAYNHFHDPLQEWDEAYLDSPLTIPYIMNYLRDTVSAILWGLDPGRQDFSLNLTGDWSWGKAKESYYIYLTGKDFEGEIVADTINARNSHFADCFRSLGQVMHLLQDMSVPLHTRNDAHILPLHDLHKGYWTYETYTKSKINDLDFIPDQSGDIPAPHFFEVPVLIQDPDYIYMVPVSGLFDRNAYNATGPIPPGNILGLAEYSNANFFTNDTMWTYPHPNRSDTNYDQIDWLNPEIVIAEDGKEDPRVYIRKTAGEEIDHLAVADYWSFEYSGQPVIMPKGFCLDGECWKEYASKLIPRAVGYSAALLDYFFRGSIEVTIPDDGFYAMTDNPEAGFTGVKLNARNTTASNEEMSNGAIELAVKYRLSQGDPFTNKYSATSSEFYYITVPEQNGVNSIPRDTPVELSFDLTGSPVPLWATDVYLQVIYKGQLGNENGAIAVGFKDISEPTPMDLFNNMDRICFYGVWAEAGDHALIAYVDNPVTGGNNNGVADEHDVYSHDLVDIYYRFFPAGQEVLWPSPQEGEYHYYISGLGAGVFDRSFYILTDHEYNYTFRTSFTGSEGDPWVHHVSMDHYVYNAIKNQIEWTEAGYARYLPQFYELRGNEMIGGVITINLPYPDPADLYACPYDELK